MASTTFLTVLDPGGGQLGSTSYPLIIPDFVELDYVLVENDIGSMTVTLPNAYTGSLFRRDARVQIWRSVDGRPAVLEGEKVWFIRRRRRKLTDDGAWLWVLTALDSKHILNRRVVAYNAGTSYTTKTDYADDMMREIVRENLSSSATDTSRRLSSTLFSVQVDLALAPSVDKAFTRRNVLEVLKDLAEASAQHTSTPTYLSFDVVVSSDPTLEFRVYSGQRGTDRRIGYGSMPHIFGPTYGNLETVEVDDDWTDEATYIYAGGQGEGVDRVIQTASDTTRIGESAYNRIERFADARQNASSAAVEDVATARLRSSRPRSIISGRVREAPLSRYGVHWNWGDYVTIDVENDRREARLSTIHVKIDDTGETITANLRSET